jgi:hypothetical protein
MHKGVMIVLSNPVSADRETEYNQWYDRVHHKEVTALAGIASLTRYKAHTQIVPPGVEPAFNYVAVYELEDVDTALRSLGEAAGKLHMSDSVDPEASLGVVFKRIAPTKD